MIQEVFSLKPFDECENIEELTQIVKIHRLMVEGLMRIIAANIQHYGQQHDWTKTEYIEDFWKDVQERKENPDFKEREWFKIHTTKEKHHLNMNVSDDATILDLLEFISDCIITAKSTGQEINYDLMKLSDSDLKLLYENTIQWLDNITEVV